MLEIIRAREKEPDRHFPKTLSREMLKEAEAEKGKWCGVLVTVAKEALYDRIRRKESQPLFGSAAQVTEDLAFALLHLYEAIRPRLDVEAVSHDEVWRVIINEVFIPTAFIMLALRQRRGLGKEFDLDASWYLPVVKEGKPWGPVRTVLHHWLKSAGFRNAHDLKKALNSDSARRSADRWLNDEVPPTIDGLHRLAGKFRKQVEWMGGERDWETRFTLACGLAHLYAAADEFQPGFSGKLRQLLRGIREENVAVDDGGVLTDSRAFFAARLIQRRLKREGSWDQIVESHVRETFAKKCPVNPTDEEMEAFRSEMELGVKPGNWLLRFIEDEAVKLNVPSAGASVIGWSLSERILEMGVRELNLILDAKRGRRGKPRQP